MLKVSVIVPVYNVEKYLRRCLDSLVSQTLKEIEIIIVNDGSPDNSQKIIDEYQKKYPKIIRAFTKKNGGLSDARNFGMKRSSGKYIAFVDSDDYVDPDMFRKMYEKADQQNLDMVGCNVVCVNDSGDVIEKVKSKLKNTKDKQEIKKNMLDFYTVAWNKIYKKSLLKNRQFKKGIWFEDVEFLYRLFPSIKSIGSIDDYGYYYVQREGSITKTFDRRLFNYIDNWNGIVHFYQEQKLWKEYHQEIEYCYVRYLYATFIKQALNYSSSDFFSQAVDAAIQNVRQNFPHYRKNKYCYRSLKGIYLVLFNRKIANIMYKIYRRKHEK